MKPSFGGLGVKVEGGNSHLGDMHGMRTCNIRTFFHKIHMSLPTISNLHGGLIPKFNPPSQGLPLYLHKPTDSFAMKRPKSWSIIILVLPYTCRNNESSGPTSSSASEVKNFLLLMKG